MKPLKKFEEYVNSGVVRKTGVDLNRSASLQKEAEKRKAFVLSIKLTDGNANYVVENSYDLLMELIRAVLYARGYSSSGAGAHEAEVSYTRIIGFSDADVMFLNDLRWRRNGILYYGKDYDVNYALKTMSFALNKFTFLKTYLRMLKKS